MKIILVTIILFFSLNIKANPSPLVFDLMREPLTLFDYGMIKLRKNVQSLPEWWSEKPYDWADKYNANLIMISGVDKLNGEELERHQVIEKMTLPLDKLEILKHLYLTQSKNVFYDLKTNRINYNILFKIENSEEKSLNISTSTCLDLRKIMAFVYLNIKGEMIYPEVYEYNKWSLATRFFDYYFTHEGYELQKFPTTLYEELVDMVHMNIYIDTYDSGNLLDEERWIYCEGHILSARPSVGRGGSEILPEFWP
ncbi:hypothetical protein OAO47_00530 [bacterium]|nr:hypothetical protein [bacterium]